MKTTDKSSETNVELGTLLVDVKQASKLLNLGQSTIWRLVKKGRLPKPIKFGSRCVRWRRASLEEWTKTL